MEGRAICEALPFWLKSYCGEGQFLRGFRPGGPDYEKICESFTSCPYGEVLVADQSKELTCKRLGNLCSAGQVWKGSFTDGGGVVCVDGDAF